MKATQSSRVKERSEKDNERGSSKIAEDAQKNSNVARHPFKAGLDDNQLRRSIHAMELDEKPVKQLSSSMIEVGQKQDGWFDEAQTTGQ